MQRIWLTLRSAFWTLVFPGTFGFYLPWRFFGVRETAFQSGDAAHWVGLGVTGLGAALLFACIVEFARKGGTLSPVDPTRELVVEGLYRYVRNPMYLAVSLIALGQALFARSVDLVIYWLAFFACANVFVIAYEEPTLRRTFGASYETYQGAVRRWWPRLRPWTPTP